MPTILWTPELDRRIGQLRAQGQSYAAIGRALGMSGKMVWYRTEQIAAGVAAHVEAASRARREQARTTMDAMENRFAAGLVDQCDGAPAQAWKLYHEQKLPPAACADRLGVDRSEFWSLIAAQARRVAELTVEASMTSRRVPPRTKPLDMAFSRTGSGSSAHG